MKKTPYPLAFIILFLFSCSRNNGNPSAGTDTKKTIYAAGWLGTAPATTAAYWKNDSLVKLPGDTAQALSIAVSGSDVYVAGNIGTTSGYWKNGTFTPLNTIIGYPLQVAGMGNDIYFVGDVPGNGGPAVGKYWKNGQGFSLAADTIFSLANAIAINGADVYIAGTQAKGNNAYILTYWKNGNPTHLTDGTRSAFAGAITVSGSDVYVAGGEANTAGTAYIAKYWKNGTPVSLSDGSVSTIVTGIAISGNDVYTAGYSFGSVTVPGYNKTTAMWWKNGSPMPLPVSPNNYSVATGILVNGADVYVVYQVSSAIQVAQYIKNGTQVRLTDSTSNANAYAITAGD